MYGHKRQMRQKGHYRVIAGEETCHTYLFCCETGWYIITCFISHFAATVETPFKPLVPLSNCTGEQRREIKKTERVLEDRWSDWQKRLAEREGMEKKS